MSRRNAAVARDVLPDPVYGSKVVTKLINQVMVDGKRSIAQKIVYEAFLTASSKLSLEPMAMFDQVMENLKPVLEVRARRVGGSTYQVPVEIRADRRQTLAIRWLVASARKRSDRTMDLRIANELIDAANNTGGAVKKKDETHRMAEANKAFAHYRW